MKNNESEDINMAVKKVAAKKAEPKKAETKKEAPKKVEPKKEVKKEAPKKTVAKDASVYHLSKNDDGRWEIKLAKIGGAAGKVIATYGTKEEAQARVKELKASTGRKALAHKSKGANKGKVHKV